MDKLLPDLLPPIPRPWAWPNVGLSIFVAAVARRPSSRRRLWRVRVRRGRDRSGRSRGGCGIVVAAKRGGAGPGLPIARSSIGNSELEVKKRRATSKLCETRVQDVDLGAGLRSRRRAQALSTKPLGPTEAWGAGVTSVIFSREASHPCSSHFADYFAGTAFPGPNAVKWRSAASAGPHAPRLLPGESGRAPESPVIGRRFADFGRALNSSPPDPLDTGGWPRSNLTLSPISNSRREHRDWRRTAGRRRGIETAARFRGGSMQCRGAVCTMAPPMP